MSGPVKPPLLFALGSDGEVYAVTPAHGAPRALRRDPAVLLAVRLTRTERVMVLDSLQPTLAAAARVMAHPPKRGA